MGKRIFYFFVCGLCRLSLRFYFRGVYVNGRENIPNDGAIIFAPNHQNAFLDAIIIAVLSPKPVSYFTRGDIFKPPFLWALDALNMVPIMRARDGFSKVLENDKTFEKTIGTMLNGRPLMLFPEAGHDYPYYLRTLSKGTARMAFDTQQKSDKPVYIIPVGLNYFRRHSPRFKLIANYGNPINIQDYMEQFAEHNGRAYTQVRNKMTNDLKDLLVIPNNDDDYERRTQVFSRRNERLSFDQIKTKASELDIIEEKSYPMLKPLIWLLTIPNIVPLMLSRYVVSMFKDPVFPGSMKFGIAALFCPFWYLLCFGVLIAFTSLQNALIIVILMIALLFVREEFVRLISPVEHKDFSKWD